MERREIEEEQPFDFWHKTDELTKLNEQSPSHCELISCLATALVPFWGIFRITIAKRLKILILFDIEAKIPNSQLHSNRKNNEHPFSLDLNYRALFGRGNPLSWLKLCRSRKPICMNVLLSLACSRSYRQTSTPLSLCCSVIKHRISLL